MSAISELFPSHDVNVHNTYEVPDLYKRVSTYTDGADGTIYLISRTERGPDRFDDTDYEFIYIAYTRYSSVDTLHFYPVCDAMSFLNVNYHTLTSTLDNLEKDATVST